MASSRLLLRAAKPRILDNIFSQQLLPHRSLSTTVSPSHHNEHQRNHQYHARNDYLNSWKPPKDPKEAQAKLSRLRRDYAMKRKDEIQKEALRIEGEERKAAKAAPKKAKAAQRQVAQEEFRQTLLKERAEKLKYHKMREQNHGEEERADSTSASSKFHMDR
ncbi:hypothetical protein L6452_23813 [Arctium lappa]|uniref:Uncharacterized protein n=1 Tax=Arctium lappa TaxID=4217 RepID=A0ACB9A7W1_ARCLA|nr:hypothetical protein L6452_23813 [Arctium lappa]